MVDSICITLLGLALILQEVQIVMLRKDVNFNNVQRKRMLKWLELQDTINHMVCDLLESVSRDEDSEVKTNDKD